MWLMVRLGMLAFVLLELAVGVQLFLLWTIINVMPMLPVGVLSQPIAMWLCCRSTRHLSTSHCPNSPAISRSEFVIMPIGFFLEQMFSWMEVGNVMHHMMAGSCLLLPSQMPPAPCLDALQ